MYKFKRIVQNEIYLNDDKFNEEPVILNTLKLMLRSINAFIDRYENKQTEK
jgi:hypothetical protein